MSGQCPVVPEAVAEEHGLHLLSLEHGTDDPLGVLPYHCRRCTGTVRPVNARDRFRGCLLGGAVGDALSAPVEFWSLAEIRSSRLGPSRVTGYVDGVAAITDDTQMTLFTAEGLIRASVRARAKGICHTPSVVHHAYLRWLHTPRCPVGPGRRGAQQ